MAMEYMTPLSTRLREENIASSTGRGNPKQAVEAIESGLAISGAVRQGFKQNEEDLKAREFEKILKGGIETMKAAREQMISAGADQNKIPDPSLYTRTAEDQQSWWKFLIGEGDRIEKKKNLAEGAKKLEEGSDVATTFGVEKELLPFEKGVENKQKTETRQRVNDLLKSLQDESPMDATTLSSLKAESLDSRKKDLQKKRQLLALSSESGEPAIKSALTAIDKEVSDIETIEREKGIQGRFEEAQFGKKLKTTIDDLEKISDTKNSLDLVEKAVPGGFEAAEKNIDALGVGSKHWRDFLNSDDAVELRQAINLYFLNATAEKSGKTVTEGEASRIEKALGLNTLASTKAFIQAMKNQKSNLQGRMEVSWSQFTPEQRKKIAATRPGLANMMPETLDKNDEKPPKKPGKRTKAEIQAELDAVNAKLKGKK